MKVCLRPPKRDIEAKVSQANRVKGIILSGGSGTRLRPMTHSVSKQLLPVYNQPMIHYRLSKIMLAGIRHILLIVKKDSHSQFSSLLGDGGEWGIKIEYAIQEHPNGVEEAFLIGETFLKEDPGVAMILGDNIFHGAGLRTPLGSMEGEPEAQVFASWVSVMLKFFQEAQLGWTLEPLMQLNMSGHSRNVRV